MEWVPYEERDIPKIVSEDEQRFWELISQMLAYFAVATGNAENMKRAMGIE